MKWYRVIAAFLVQPPPRIRGKQKTRKEAQAAIEDGKAQQQAAKDAGAKLNYDAQLFEMKKKLVLKNRSH